MKESPDHYILLMENIMGSCVIVFIYCMALGYHFAVNQQEHPQYADVGDWICYIGAVVSGGVFFVVFNIWWWS